MKKKVVSIVKPIIFLMLGVAMLWKLQKVLTPDFSTYVAPHMLSGIDALEIEDLDAVFLGASHVYLGVSPMELYDKHGLCTYVLGSAAQPIELSYFLLEKAYETHNIKAVFLDMSMLFHSAETRSDWNGSMRTVLDQLELGPLKIQMAREYAKNEKSDGFLSTIVPIIKYHSNWTRLTWRSFHTETKTFDYALGQMLPSICEPSSITLEDVECETAALFAYSGKAVVSTEGTVTSTLVDQPLYMPGVPDSNLEYLSKIRDLCASHNSRLVLFKVPTRQLPQTYPGAWTSIKSGVVSALAEEYQLPFLDIQYSAPALLDFEKDTMDEGMHLNAIGAAKVSNYIGEYIREQGLAEPERNDVYDSLLEQYKKAFSIVELQTTTDFDGYLARLKEAGDHWTVVVSAAKNYVGGMVDEDYRLLSDFGLELIGEGGVRDSYIGVVSKGETIYESYSDYPAYYNDQIEGNGFSAVSINEWLTGAGASIQVDGQEYSLGGTGLNIVVYDHETGLVVDAVSFDTTTPEKSCYRNQSLNYVYLLKYQAAIKGEQFTP